MKHTLCRIAAAVAALLGCTTAHSAAPTQVQHPQWSRNAVIYEVNTRQYTPEGTFRAFAGQLPRLRDLGVDILWFMPIHPISEDQRKGTLGSYYSVRDFRAVNPEFGTLEDFKAVVDQAHALGMKVIIDWVPNHSGCDNAWVTEHPEYYARNEEGKMFGPFDWTDVYQLDYSKPETRRVMTDAMKFWLTEAGIDGFRCDVAGRVPVDYWNEAREELQAVQPELFMLAEATEPFLMEKAFDMDYDWPMKDLFSAIAATAGQYTYVNPQDGKMRTFPEKHASDIATMVASHAAEYPADSYMMEMITNHDLNSWEGTEFRRLGNLQEAFAVLTYTLPGMPLIYTGQETGMDRALEFFEKDSAPQWEPRNKYFAFYQTMNSLKHRRPELAAGEQGGAIEFLPVTMPDIVAFTRTKGNSKTLVIANLGKMDLPLEFTGEAPSLEGALDAFTGFKPSPMPTVVRAGEYLLYTFN